MAPPEGLVLRSSRELAQVPMPRPPLVIREVKIATPVQAATLGRDGPDRTLTATVDPWLMIGLAALAGAGWILERRRRQRLETENDSVLWAGVQPPSSSIITTTGEFEPTLPPDSIAAAPAPPIPMQQGGVHTVSRREATLFDLQQLHAKLRRRLGRGDPLAAVSLLQKHLAEFRFTSPWVFLELRELHLLLGREQEWEVARADFQERFGQKPPVWRAPSTADVQLADDAQICGELIAEWPYREARMVILRWMLGDSDSRQQGYVPALLALGVARELLFLDRLLEELDIARPPATDFLL